MARCYNCGTELTAEDGTRLCESCKQVMLPFLKFVGASTSSSVRRLVSNEQNLRSRGVTDTGMEYLLKICELQDRNRAAEASVQPEAPVSDPLDEYAQPEEPQMQPYMEVELPQDEPLRVRRKPYGTFLSTSALVLAAAGAFLIVWFIVGLFTKEHTIDVIPLFSGAACLFSAYVAETCRKLLGDVEELKKRFR